MTEREGKTWNGRVDDGMGGKGREEKGGGVGG